MRRKITALLGLSLTLVAPAVQGQSSRYQPRILREHLRDMRDLRERSSVWSRQMRASARFARESARAALAARAVRPRVRIHIPRIPPVRVHIRHRGRPI